jgi:hypothetical protein
MALDGPACTAVIRAGLETRGVVATWQEVLAPVLASVGERWRMTGRGIEVEHLLCECVEDGLREVARGLTRPRNIRPVLLAGLDTEEHRLPLHALAAALAERSVAVRMLGPRLPVEALAAAVARTGAGAVFAWAHAPVAGTTVQGVDDLPVQRPAAAVVLGGPGWRGSLLPQRARWVPDLPTAVEAVCAAVGVAASPADSSTGGGHSR